MSHIVQSRNLFIDTTSGNSPGDVFNLELGANMLQAQDGQFMRLTLVNFNINIKLAEKPMFNENLTVHNVLSHISNR